MVKTLSLTENTIFEVVRLVSEGVSIPEAFRAAGISSSTRTRWLRRGRGLEGPSDQVLADFVQKLEAAQAEAISKRAARHEEERRLRLAAYRYQQTPRVIVVDRPTPVSASNVIRVHSRRRNR